jgi:hypothetical protein
MLKKPAEYEETLRRQNSRPFLATFLLLCYQMAFLVNARELWGMNQELLEFRWRHVISVRSAWDALYDNTT